MKLKERAQKILEERKFLLDQALQATLNELREDERFSQAEKKYRSTVFNVELLKSRGEDASEMERKLPELKKELEEAIDASETDTSAFDYEIAIAGTSKEMDEKAYESILDEIADFEISKGITQISDINDIRLTDSQKKNKRPFIAMLQAMGNLLETYPDHDKPNILIAGSVGCGKTYAATVLKNAFIKKHKADVEFLMARELSDIFWEIHTSHINNEQDPFGKILEPEMLIIDDLGTEPQFNNVTIPYLLYLIDARISLNKPTVITTNLSESEIESKYGERILSRLLSPMKCISIKLAGKDERYN